MSGTTPHADSQETGTSASLRTSNFTSSPPSTNSPQVFIAMTTDRKFGTTEDVETMDLTQEHADTAMAQMAGDDDHKISVTDIQGSCQADEQDESMNDRDPVSCHVLVETRETVIYIVNTAPHLVLKVPKNPFKKETKFNRKRGDRSPIFKEGDNIVAADKYYRMAFHLGGNRASDAPMFRLPRVVARMQTGDDSLQFASEELARDLRCPGPAQSAATELSEVQGAVAIFERVPVLPAWIRRHLELPHQEQVQDPSAQFFCRIAFGRTEGNGGKDEGINIHPATESVHNATVMVDLDIGSYQKLKEATKGDALALGYDTLPDATIVSYELGRALGALHSAGIDGRSVDFVLAGGPMYLDPGRSRQTSAEDPKALASFTFPIQQYWDNLMVSLRIDPSEMSKVFEPHQAFRLGPRLPHLPSKRGLRESMYWDPRCEETPAEPKGDWAFWVMNLGNAKGVSGSEPLKSEDNLRIFIDAFFEDGDKSENFTFPRIRPEPDVSVAGDPIRTKRAEFNGSQGACADYFETGYADAIFSVEPWLGAFLTGLKNEQAWRDEPQKHSTFHQVTKRSNLRRLSTDIVTTYGRPGKWYHKRKQQAKGSKAMSSVATDSMSFDEDSEDEIAGVHYTSDQNQQITDKDQGAREQKAVATGEDMPTVLGVEGAGDSTEIDTIVTDNANIGRKLSAADTVNSPETASPSKSSAQLISFPQHPRYDPFAKARNKLTSIRKKMEKPTEENTHRHTLSGPNTPLAGEEVLKLVLSWQSGRSRRGHDRTVLGVDDQQLPDSNGATRSNVTATSGDEIEIGISTPPTPTGYQDQPVDPMRCDLNTNSRTTDTHRSENTSEDNRMDIADDDKNLHQRNRQSRAMLDLSTLRGLLTGIDRNPRIRRRMMGYPIFEDAQWYVHAQAAREREGVEVNYARVLGMIADLTRAVNALEKRHVE